MTAIDLTSLAAPISDELPSGEDLEYDPQFLELDRACQGKPEQQFGATLVPAEDPDWRVVHGLAQELLGRTKDVRVAIQFARASLHLSGLEGFTAVLGLIRRYVEDFWPTFHPALDADDDNDPTMRINAMVAIQDPAALLKPLRETPLVRAPRVGSFSLRDIQIARNEIPPPEDATPPSLTTIEAAFTDADPDDLRITAEALQSALADLAAIEAYVAESVGSHQAPDLSPLQRILRDMDRTLSEQRARLGQGPASEMDDDANAPAAGGAGPAAPGSGEIRSRADVTRAIDRILAYYQTAEPASAVPILLRRAQRLVPMTFVELIRDLAPDGLSQIQVIGGIDESEDN